MSKHLLWLFGISLIFTSAPQAKANQSRDGELRVLTAEEKDSLLKAREAVWRAWFTGDRAALLDLLPPELITLGDGPEGWGTSARVRSRNPRIMDGRFRWPECDHLEWAGGLHFPSK